MQKIFGRVGSCSALSRNSTRVDFKNAVALGCFRNIPFGDPVIRTVFQKQGVTKLVKFRYKIEMTDNIGLSALYVTAERAVLGFRQSKDVMIKEIKAFFKAIGA